MKKQATNLFIFSFICFIVVLIFGSLLNPIKKSLVDTDIFRNFSLFHSHFDQLCWLGSAALGCTFYALDNRYSGSKVILAIFTFSYTVGSLLFSSGFLFRAIGKIFKNGIIEKGAAIGMISLGGLLILVAAFCALYIAYCIIFYRKCVNGVLG